MKLRDGHWVKPDPIPGAVFINISDMMQRWTADVFKSNVRIFVLLSINQFVVKDLNGEIFPGDNIVKTKNIKF